MTTIKICPICGAKKFIVTAHITQSWEVDENGQYTKTVEECEDVTHAPDDDDIWTCAECGHDAPGSEFNKEVEKTVGIPEKAGDDSIDITVYASSTMAFTEEECDIDNLTQIRVKKDLLKRWLGETWSPSNSMPSSITEFLDTYTADSTERLVWWLLDNGYGLEIPGKKLYRYGMRLRPYDIGCQPKEGFLWRETPDRESKYHDIIVYRSPLTDEDVEYYSLSPIGM